MTSKTWNCCSSDTKGNLYSKTGYYGSNFSKRREGFAFTVKKHDFDSPQTTQLDKRLTDVSKKV